MVTYLSGVQELLVRVQIPHPDLEEVIAMIKRLFCFLSAVMVAASSVFAADDIPWVSPTFTFTNAVANECFVDASGHDYKYRVNSDGSLDQSSVTFVSNRDEFSFFSNPLTSEGSSYVSSRPLFTLDGSYWYDTDNYQHNVVFPDIVVSSHTVFFNTSLVLPPGYYQFRSATYATYTLGVSATGICKPVFSQLGFYGVDTGATAPIAFVPLNQDALYTDYVYFDQPVSVGFGFTFPTYTVPLVVEGQNSVVGQIKYEISRYFLEYRTVDPADVAALNQANQDAGNSMQDYDSTEQQFTQSMTDNFNKLNLQNFQFPSGLLSGFSLITSIFERIWNGMGEYQILFVFPLVLGIVLLLIGRISKFSGGQSSGRSSRGNDDA